MTTARHVRELEPGAQITYHTGFGLKGASAEVLAAVRRGYDQGDLELCQGRAPDGSFEYRAQRRRRQAKVDQHHTFRFYDLVRT